MSDDGTYLINRKNGYGQRGGTGLLENSDDDDRKGFIVKVYVILTVQLVLTFGSVAMVTCSDSMRENLQDPDNVTALVFLIICSILAIVI